MLPALPGAAVTVANLVNAVHRAVEDIGPALLAELPHRQRFGPAIRVELQGDGFIGRCVFRNAYIKGDRLGGANMPGRDRIEDRRRFSGHDQLPHGKIPIQAAFGIPESISEGVLVAHIRTDGQGQDDPIAAIG